MFRVQLQSLESKFHLNKNLTEKNKTVTAETATYSRQMNRRSSVWMRWCCLSFCSLMHLFPHSSQWYSLSPECNCEWHKNINRIPYHKSYMHEPFPSMKTQMGFYHLPTIGTNKQLHRCFEGLGCLHDPWAENTKSGKWLCSGQRPDLCTQIAFSSVCAWKSHLFQQDSSKWCSLGCDLVQFVKGFKL